MNLLKINLATKNKLASKENKLSKQGNERLANNQNKLARLVKSSLAIHT
jgi:hypothetical protein